ncbi:hypothetical protein AB0G67_40665 [Streptomyces sp. NPDC021056]|uniref:hypothetical protein n=1 Tax=Streptomyces sp. NPDC021056 TaxID=3155012 RepID=UPI0033F0F845
MAKPRVKVTINKGALQKVARQATRDLASKLTRALNALTPQYQGRPLDEVKRAVQQTWARNSGGGSITDPELTEFAEKIAAGGRVEVRAK